VKLTPYLISEKLTKHTNSSQKNYSVERTTEQTRETPKLTVRSRGNKLAKLTEKWKLTSIPGNLQRWILRISNNIRYPFVSSEYVSLQNLTTCEEKTEGVKKQYKNSLQRTHRTHKLIPPAGGV